MDTATHRPARAMHMPDLPTPDIDRDTLRYAVVGGGVAALVMGVGVVTVGLSGLGGDNARSLLEAMLPTARTLFSTAMIASSTTLALMLTMLGMTSDEPIKSGFYGQIRQAATIAVGVFAAATVVLLVLAIPFQEGGAGQTAYTVLYYVIAGVGALIGGAIVAVMITLHGAITSLIGLVDDDAEASIAADDDGE